MKLFSRMFRSPPAILLSAVLVTSGCLDVSGSQVISLPFDFSVASAGLGDGWVVGVADVPAARVADVQVSGEYGTLPAPYASYSGIRQSGTSISGSLFIFHKKWIQSPWSPGTMFHVTLDMVLVSDQQLACTTGPGPAVVVKAGASGDEPVATTDAQGVLRLNLDKGAGTSGGVFAQLGDIRNGLEGCPAQGTWQARSTDHGIQSQTLTVDPTGGFWIFFGTQSAYSGRHDVYFTQVRLSLTRQ